MSRLTPPYRHEQKPLETSAFSPYFRDTHMRSRLSILVPLVWVLGCEDLTGVLPDLYGTVTIDGLGAPGISVEATTFSSVHRTTTTTDGTYSFSQLPRGSVTVRVFPPAANVLFNGRSLTTTLDGNRRQVDFAGFGPREARGRLYWSTSAAIAGVPGVAVRMEGAPFPVPAAVTGTDGWYVFPAAPGTGIYDVVLGEPPHGLVIDVFKQWQYDPRTRTQELTPAWYRPDSHLVVVVLIDGEPSSGSTVHLPTPLPISAVIGTQLGHPRSLRFNNLPVMPVDVSISGFPSTVDFDVTMKTVVLLANVEDTLVFNGFTRGRNRAPAVAITAPQNGATFPLGSSVRFEGNAVDPEDGPLTGSALTWTTGADTLGTGGTITTSSLPLGSHTITLTATDTNGASNSAAVSITISPVTGGRVTGTVTVYGEPRAGVRLTLSTAPNRVAVTNANGVYSFDDVPPGTYQVTIEPPQFTAFSSTTQSVTVTTGATATINFEGHIGY